MGKVLRALQRGAKAAAEVSSGSRFEFESKALLCQLCGHDRFHKGEATLTSRGLGLFGLGWAAPSATTLTCAECGRIEWFSQAPAQDDR